jgi:hypothetical protein
LDFIFIALVPIDKFFEHFLRGSSVIPHSPLPPPPRTLRAAIVKMMKSLKISLKEKQDLLEQVLRLQPEDGHQVRELEGKNY